MWGQGWGGTDPSKFQHQCRCLEAANRVSYRVAELGGGGTDLDAEVLGFLLDVPPLGGAAVGRLGGLRCGVGLATVRVLAPRNEARGERSGAGRRRTRVRKVGVPGNLGAGTCNGQSMRLVRNSSGGWG